VLNRARLLGLMLLPASVIAGVLYDRVDARVPFYFGSLTATAAALLMVLLLRQRPRPAVMDAHHEPDRW